ncbi:4-(cytidine 5'-diphospho)-2-C-methyl-D-erythritol kinase [Terracoccus luteus]|uniref:4-diphosphocytidyl-2-C-methyl-D-erythritol kinase n=1 Tax=Terracoccus luteus TaxID=53356 RepID=A0A839PZE5_9MICO|nr:4-(cytidine 5'-diphospho)-2-C-methyl-D-erythritol kinase [Terracoccus luteus]MBB2985761.1 4-diphosphocytidyl-2-C-methyl-D-erythritol kinase [Terracoccus luteus]MCP2171413.1 4-diphosphocytidyl-2-C-methyl-D-erythritol kinase [Terracoccus luteus]
MTAAPTLPGTVTVRVPAKVNLQLHVGALRPDGYHDLATVFQAVSLHDEVSVARWDGWQVVPAGTYADGIPTDEDNLAVRAAKLVAERCGVDESLSIRIDKDIPVAGGMAGGSADAAAALLACDQLWALGLDRDELAEMAAVLGSDVTFPLSGGTAMATGRGEQLAPVLARGTFHWVFAISDEGLSTPAVYAELDRMREESGESVAEPQVRPDLMAALRQGDAAALGNALHNDLEPAAFSLRPDLRELRDAGVEFGALGGIVSGSGPTVAFVTESHEAALDLSVSLAAADLCRDLRRAKGPVHGAQVVAGPRD